MTKSILVVALACGLAAGAWAEDAKPAASAETAAAKEKRPAYKGVQWRKFDVEVNYELSMTTNAIGNTADLGRSRDLDGDGRKEKDEVSYLSEVWNVSLAVKYDDWIRGAVVVDSNGPFEYAAPLLKTRTLNTTSGAVGNYRDQQLLPQVEECWMDFGGDRWPIGVKAGLFKYDVGHGIAGPGYYANYGLNLYGSLPKTKWTLHYHRPDLNRAAQMSGRIRQEEKVGVEDNHVNAHYFALDTVVSGFDWMDAQGYVNVLVDNTAAGRRLPSAAEGLFSRDVLGILGGSLTFRPGKKWKFGFEAASNFGRAYGTDGTRSFTHAGYMWQADLTYEWSETFQPRFKVFYLSGQKYARSDASGGDIYDGRNTEFAVYSPTNYGALLDTHYPSAIGPLIACGGGSALNLGVPRPNASADPWPHANMTALNLGLDWQIMKKLSSSWDVWLMRANEPGYGAFEGGTKALPNYLGTELDASLTYELGTHTSVNLLGGVFLPGSYYLIQRDDAPNYSYTARTDGSAAPAFQLEMGFKVKF